MYFVALETVDFQLLCPWHETASRVNCTKRQTKYSSPMTRYTMISCLTSNLVDILKVIDVYYIDLKLSYEWKETCLLMFAESPKYVHWTTKNKTNLTFSDFFSQSTNLNTQIWCRYTHRMHSNPFNKTTMYIRSSFQLYELIGH